jgi:sugar diacid utilization regulator
MHATEKKMSAKAKAVRALRSRVATATLARLENLLEDLLEQIRTEVVDYAGIERARLVAEARPVFRAMALTLIRAAGGETRPDPSTLALLRERAQLLASEGFPLHAVLLAYSACTRVVWHHLADDLQRHARAQDASSQAVSEMSLAVIRLREKLTGDVADAYAMGVQEHALSAKMQQRDVIEQLLDGEATNPQAAIERVDHMGYHLGESHAVAVLTVDGLEVLAPGLRDRAERILHEMPEAMRSLTLTCAEPLVEVRHRRLAGLLESSVVAILPFEEEVSETHLKAAIESAVGPLDLPPGCQLLVGLGRAEAGVSGIAISYQQAQRALEAAHATRAHTGVVSYTSALPTLILLQDPTLAEDSWLATLQPLLAHDAAEGTQLVSTLSAYLEERGVLAATARRLFVHRHTLAARLEQIEELTGRSLRDRDDLLMLELGLRARRFADEAPFRGQSERSLDHLSDSEVIRDPVDDDAGA